MFEKNKDEIKYYLKLRHIKILITILIGSAIAILSLTWNFLYPNILVKIPPTIKYILLLILLLMLILQRSYINHLLAIINEFKTVKEKSIIENAKEELEKTMNKIHKKDIDIDSFKAFK